MAITRQLNTVGKRTFVNCFEARQNKGRELSEIEVMNADEPYSESWEESSLRTKTSAFNRIFRENLQCEALKICCGANKLSNQAKAKAIELNEKYCSFGVKMPENKTPKLIEGKPALIVIDIQGGETDEEESPIPSMPGYQENMDRAPALIKKARQCDIPVVFIQEAHRPDLIDFGRELDGAEGIHLLENDAGTEISKSLGMKPDDYFIRKRRYSCFFGTDFEILMKGLGARTLIMIGGHTDVCVHYSFVDGHQHDYYCRVVEDCVAGSSLSAHKASLEAMAYLQTGARRSSKEIMTAFDAYKNVE